jgi:uncharacterized membrane protein
MDRWAAELVVVVVSYGIFVGYHLYLFLLHDRIHPHVIHSAWRMGKKARGIACASWTRKESDVINGVQAVRNAMTAITFMSALTGILATLIVPIMLDPVKTAQIEKLALSDPILRDAAGRPLVRPIVVLGCGLAVLWASFCYFVQAMRMFVHLGFLMRAVPSPLNHDRSGRPIFSELDARRVSVKAGAAFTVGLRLWYLFVPTIAWAFGVTPLLISSVLITALLVSFDRYEVRPERPEDELDDDECAHGALLLDDDAAAAAAAGAGAGARAAGGEEASLSAGMGRAGAGDVELGAGGAAAAAGSAAAAAAAGSAAGGAAGGRPNAGGAPPTPAATPAASGAASPPGRAASAPTAADLARLSSSELNSALSWNRCPGNGPHRAW